MFSCIFRSKQLHVCTQHLEMQLEYSLNCRFSLSATHKAQAHRLWPCILTFISSHQDNSFLFLGYFSGEGIPAILVWPYAFSPSESPKARSGLVPSSQWLQTQMLNLAALLQLRDHNDACFCKQGTHPLIHLCVVFYYFSCHNNRIKEVRQWLYDPWSQKHLTPEVNDSSK